MGSRHQNLRNEERIPASLPVKLGKKNGKTRDVSASGVFFETDASFAVGNKIRFSVDLDAPGGKMVLKCLGRIVRLEPRDPLMGVGVSITESRLEAA